MIGPRQAEQGVLFYNFSLDSHVPAVHLLRSIDRFVGLSELRRELAPFYSSMGRPSVAPELMIRMRKTSSELTNSKLLPIGAITAARKSSRLTRRELR